MPENRDLTVLHLFTEIAIVEHLLRNRHDTFKPANMTNGQFGVLNYFVRNKLSEATLSTLAWSFQDEDDYMAEKIEQLRSANYVTTQAIEGSNIDVLVKITEAGTAAHTRALNEIRPEVESLLVDLTPVELETAMKVLQEIRRTLDNLPDR
jgi:DNA-binding MarR family transcriptional regulator